MIAPNPVLLDCLCYLAWCDGHFHEAERKFMQEVLTQMGLTIEEQDHLLAAPRPMPDEMALAAACPDLGTRREFLKLANRLTRLDDNLADEEWMGLRHICQAFGMRRIRHWDQLQSWLS